MMVVRKVMVMVCRVVIDGRDNGDDGDRTLILVGGDRSL